MMVTTREQAAALTCRDVKQKFPLRARKVVRPSGGIVRGKFASRKNNRMVHFEGTLERDAYYLLEAAPEVLTYREQPVTLLYPDGDRLRKYTPDLALDLSNGETVYVEIKPESVAQQPDMAHKLASITAHLARTGPRFLVLTDTVIRQNPRFETLRWLYRRASKKRSTHEQQGPARLLLQHLPASIGEVADLLESRGLDAYGLLLDGVFQCDLDGLISAGDIVLSAEPTRCRWPELWGMPNTLVNSAM